MPRQGGQSKSVLTAAFHWHSHINLSTAWETADCDYIGSMDIINVHLQHCIISKILCPKPPRFPLSSDVQSYFEAVLFSFRYI